ncbi:hypothetical protein F4805DRAFT_474725 [Annulohypoxylon moriforme]|nr:hypothetical protein F4805DRAFT_474725 [Annulohypoxylon moriforme]
MKDMSPSASTITSQKPRNATLRCSIQTTYYYPDDTQHRDDDDSSHDDEDNFLFDDEPIEEKINRIWLPKAVALCQYLWPSVKDDALSVNFLGAGSYNVALSISMVTTEDETVEYVLRIPDYGINMTRSAGILEYLNRFTDLNVPKLIAWDATTNNPLKKEYMIISRIPGKCLHDIWKDLPHDQRLLFAKELARLYHQIESITNPTAGVIQVHGQDIKYRDELIDRIFVQAFGTNTMGSHLNPIDWDTPKDGVLPVLRDPPGLSVNDIMTAIFKRRIYQVKNMKESWMDYTLSWHELCQKIIEDMVDMGLFDPQNDEVCLRHPDLFARNIMVDFSPDITITGVLDWDEAMFVPKFAGRILPRWLWQSAPADWSGTVSGTVSYFDDNEPLDFEGSGPNSLENVEIKSAFDNAVGEAWLSEASSEWLALARALLAFSREHLYSEETDEKIALWKNKWRSLSTDAVENLYFWTEKRNLSIFEEPESPEYEEVVLDKITSEDEPASCSQKDNEETSCKDNSTNTWEDRTRAQFRRILPWVLSMPTTSSCPKEPHSAKNSSTTLTREEALALSSMDSLPKDFRTVHYSTTGIEEKNLPRASLPYKTHSIENPSDDCSAVPVQGQSGILTTTRCFIHFRARLYQRAYENVLGIAHYETVHLRIEIMRR